MKITIEGEPDEISKLFSIKESSATSDKKRIVIQDYAPIKQTDSELSNVKLELAAKQSKIAELEAKIQELQYENNFYSLDYDKLNDKQLAVVEKIYQDMIKVHNIKPISFGNGSEVITAKKMIESIFSLLTSGQRVLAIKEIRTVTGIGLLPAKNLVDNLIKSLISNKNLKQEIK